MELNLEGLFVAAFLAIIIYMIVEHLKLCNNTQNTQTTKEPFTTSKRIRNKLRNINDNVNKIKVLRDEIKADSERNADKKNYNYELIKKLEETLQEKQDVKQSEEQIKTDENTKKTLTGYENEIRELHQQLKELPDIGITSKDTRTIKSLENGLRLSIQNIQNKLNTHLISANNKCLSVDSVGNYILKKCDIKDPKQHFISKIISSPSAYLANLEKGLNHNKYDVLETRFPVTMIKSYNNQSCLQNNSNNLSIQPCTAKTSQQWKSLKDANKCGPDTTTKC
jgi:hypothetical protein